MGGPHSKVVFVCQSCGFSNPKWLGRCPGCGEWNTFVEEEASRPPRLPSAAPAVAYSDVETENSCRIPSGSAEFDRVLGGGVVPGSLVLLGGEPGVGKSTLLLQIAENLGARKLKVLYAAGEESTRQIKLRGQRLNIRGDGLLLSSETCLERVLDESAAAKPDVMVVDSIQTLYSERLGSIPGSIGQIRECAAQLLSYAKRDHVTVFLIGHITKDGSLAGPKALEHIVDTVLYFEGERRYNQRIIRATKNRFGPANELGIFEMSGRGLVGVENPSQWFLSERAASVSGSVVSCAVEGSRPMLVEIQALVSRTKYSTAKRMANGVDPNRVSLLLAMIEKRLGLHLMASDVYVNVAGGLALDEPASDLAVVAAVLSSFRDLPLAKGTVVFGEVGLAGEIRAVSSAYARVREAASLGFEQVILPSHNLPLTEPVDGVQLAGCVAVAECLSWLDSRR
jgi:DNA repair protein RadA/Sms